MFKSLMVIAPHADDDILGCGGLIHRVSESGGSVVILLINMEEHSRLEELNNSYSHLKNPPEIRVFGYWVKSAAPSIRNVASWVDDRIQEFRPEVVAIPNQGSAHQDHRLSAEAGIISCRPSGGTETYRPQIVFSYEVAADVWPPRQSISPQFTVALSHSDLSFKMKAMMEHKSQIRMYPSERSLNTIENLARLRGSQAGVELGESYEVLRWLMM